MRWKLFIIVAIFALNSGEIKSQDNVKKIKLSGFVKDNSGNPVEGVMFFVDGKKVNKISDSKGFYRFKISPTAENIKIVSFDLGTIELLYDGSDRLDFTFEGTLEYFEGEPKVADDVVDIGYGTVKEKDMTTDVSQIKNNEIKATKYQNIYEMIKGEVPGVIVNGSSIRIQGTGSIMGSNEPLFIVNGMETPAIGHIPPSDVASISVLKGASATIYGSRGSNGVIVIKLR